MSEKRGLVTADNLNVRMDPSTKKQPIGQLKKGTEVAVLDRIDDWYKIRFETTGFISSRFVDITEDTRKPGRFSERIKKMLMEEEGSVSHMYLDTVGKVTVGVGFMLPSPEDAKKLKFINRETGETASDTEIEREFNTVQEQETGYRATYYKQFTRLDCPEEEIDTHLETRIAEFQEGLRKHFDNYDIYPQAAQEGLLDMAFNLGVDGLVNKFPSFTRAAQEGDWRKCALECHRRGISEARNLKTKELFAEAASA